MEPKFNFYDFVGYIIPGALIQFLLYWFILSFLNVTIPFKLETVADSIIFLFSSYFFGQLVQARGNIVEEKIVEKWGGWFSEQLLRDNNTFFTLEFKNNLRKMFQKKLGLSYDGTSIKEIDKQKRDEIFYLCYFLLFQKKTGEHTDIYMGVYGLYRGLITVWQIGIVISSLIVLKDFVLLIFTIQKYSLPNGVFWQYDKIQFALGIIIFLFFIVSERPLKSRLKRFSKHFAASVYRNFYVLYSNELENDKTAS